MARHRLPTAADYPDPDDLRAWLCESDPILLADEVIRLRASLADVLALCARATDSGSFLLQVGTVRAAATGEDT